MLVILIRIMPQENAVEALISGVYLSSNAIFLLMTLFVWLRPEEYRNYITLYISGKVIILVSFYAWVFFSAILVSPEYVPQLPALDHVARNVLILGGCVLLSLMDTLSIWGAWTLKNKNPGGI